MGNGGQHIVVTTGNRGTHKNLARAMDANEITQGYLKALEDDLRIIRTTQAARMTLILKALNDLKKARRIDEKRLMRIEAALKEQCNVTIEDAETGQNDEGRGP
jgi:hypothetical protein